MRRRSDIRGQQCVNFKALIDEWETTIDRALDAVDETNNLPLYFNLHEDAAKYPLLPEILAERYRHEGGFDVLICYDDDNRLELEIG